MNIILTGLILTTLSAVAADADTTAQFTRHGIREGNPLARPFVAGHGVRDEILGTLVASGIYLRVNTLDEPQRTTILGLAALTHTILAIRNQRHLRRSVTSVPPIIFPILVIIW